MKILLLYNTMDRPETEVLQYFAAPEFELEVVCNTSSGCHDRLRQFGIPHEHRLCKNKVDFSAIKFLRAKLAATRYDVIHAFTARWLSAALAATAFSKNPPAVVAYRGALGNVGRFDPLAWISFRHPRVKLINCVSNAVLEYLQNVGIPSNKLRRIYKGHDISWYATGTKALRSEFNIPEDAFVVTCVANVRPNKGVDLIVDAATELAGMSNLHFLLVGDMRGSKIEELAGNSPAAERIHIVGLRNDVANILRSSNAFVMPTRFAEGLPKAVIEAMALSVPVIVTRIGGMVELVRDGIDGLVIDPRSAAAIAAAIVKLASVPNLCETLGTAGKARIVNDFNISGTVAETKAFYKAALL